MASLIFLLLLAFGFGIIILVAMRRNREVQAIAPGLALLGGLIAVLAMTVLPWVKSGPPGALANNLQWLAGQKKLVDLLHEVSAFDGAARLVEQGPAADPRDIPGPAEQVEFLRTAQQALSLQGWHVWKLSRPFSPWLSLALGLGMLSVAIGGLAALANLVRASFPGRMIGCAAGALAGASLLLLASRIAAVDSLGSTRHFLVRFIAAMAEVRVGPGPWWMAVGLILIVCSGLAYLFFDEARPTPEPDPVW